MQRLALRHDLGVFFETFEDVARRDRLCANARAARPHFAFDTHADDLVTFFRRVVASARAKMTT